MDGDFIEMVGDFADWFGLGAVVKGALRGGDPAVRTGRDDDEEAPYVYERVLTRPRRLNINDR